MRRIWLGVVLSLIASISFAANISVPDCHDLESTCVLDGGYFGQKVDSSIHRNIKELELLNLSDDVVYLNVSTRVYDDVSGIYTPVEIKVIEIIPYKTSHVSLSDALISQAESGNYQLRIMAEVDHTVLITNTTSSDKVIYDETGDVPTFTMVDHK